MGDALIIAGCSFGARVSTARMARGDLRVHLVERDAARSRAHALDQGIQRHEAIDACAGLPLDELWLVLAPRAGFARRASVADQLGPLLDAAAALAPPERAFLVVVGAPAPDAEAAAAAFHGRVARGRVVLAPPIADEAEAGLQLADAAGVMRFLAALHAVRRELDERAPGFFDHHAIRCAVAPDARLPLARPERAAREVVAARDGGGAAPHRVVPDAAVSVAELCEVAAIVHGASVLPVGPEVALTAIDRLFADRARGFDDHAADADGAPLLEGAALEELVEAIKRRQDECLDRARGRAASLLAEPLRRTVARPGSELTYLAAGAGERLFLLNALGQGLPLWTRLIVELARRYRVVAWEPRGLDDDAPVTLDDQIGDLEAVARAEGAERLGLVAWCTGPKVAIEYHLRHPGAVMGIVMLNPSFKCEGSPPELESDFDRDFEPVCRALVRRPELAASLAAALGRAADDAAPSLELEGEPLAAAVLAATNRALRDLVRAPFRSAQTLARYARQVHDFWSRDARAAAPRVDVPVLLVSAEHDRMASPESARLAAGLFPRGEAVFLEGATHYGLYDNPELIGELVEDFMERCA